MKTMQIIFAVNLCAALTATASLWSGGTGNWNSDGDPGWNGTGVPNAVGAIADFAGFQGTATITAGDNFTIGQLLFYDMVTSQGNRTISGVLTFDNTPECAVISNGSTRASMDFNSTTRTINGDLLIIKTGTPTGRINLNNSSFTGTGKIITDSNSNSMITTTDSIHLGNSAHVGSLLVRRGSASAVNNYGNAANLVTLGVADGGSVTFTFTGSSILFPNKVIVTAGTGGETLFGNTYVPTAGVNPTAVFGGEFELGQNLALHSGLPDPYTANYTGKIYGVGGIKKIGVGNLSLNAANEYEGGTLLADGTIIVGNANALGTGALNITDGATLQLNTSATVDSLKYNGKLQLRGTYGATGSGAKHEDDARFSGTGILTALNGVEDTTVLIVK